MRSNSSKSSASSSDRGGAVCIGGACVDRKYLARSRIRPGTSNPAQTRRSFGGVARNVAENLARLSVPVALLSLVGTDEGGEALLRHASRCGIDTGLVIRDGRQRTCEYAAILEPDGGLLLGMADMTAIECISVEDVAARWDAMEHAAWLFVDCNVSSAVLAYCIERARESVIHLAVDAVSESKVRKLPENLHGIDLLVLNEGEAAALLGEDPAERDTRERARALQERGAVRVTVTLGRAGSIVASENIVDVPALEVRCADATGAGDALVAGTLYGLLTGRGASESARLGAACAALTVESPESVRPDLSPQLLEALWTTA
jgi:pseudouridine kinase